MIVTLFLMEGRPRIVAQEGLFSMYFMGVYSTFYNGKIILLQIVVNIANFLGTHTSQHIKSKCTFNKITYNYILKVYNIHKKISIS